MTTTGAGTNTPETPASARHGDVDIAGAAALFADPARGKILMALNDGRSLPASRLADEAGISAQSASGHLKKLVDGGLLRVSATGRHRYYALAGDAVGVALEGLAAVGQPREVTSLRQGTRAHALRRARTCYDHLAGYLGVAVAQGLLDTGAIERSDGAADNARREGDPLAAGTGDTTLYVLGPNAATVLPALGVDIDALRTSSSSRPLIRACVDWTEQRHHIAGRLGAAIATAWTSSEWITRSPRDRSITVTPVGRRHLERVLAVPTDLDSSA